MVKIISVLGILLSSVLYAESLNQSCLECHKIQQIPNQLVYRRYLSRYSTEKNIENAMFQYLENPKKERSIMPPQFFLKFPMKNKTEIQKDKIRQKIRQFINRFDIKKKLVLEKNSH